MLSAVLRSETAVAVSIQIINAFVQMRHFIQHNAKVFERLESVERRQIVFEKDLGKKWFAFSKFETGAIEMLKRLEGKNNG